MANGISTALTTVALVLGIPAACGAGLLLYGKALADAEVAEGHLMTPEESRRAMEEAQRRFNAMTPAEHLAKARQELNCGYDPALRIGGNLRAVEQHLSAIPDTAPEHTEIPAMRQEAAARRARVRGVPKVIIEQAVRADAADPGDEGERKERREHLVHRLDQLSRHGLGCVHFEGGDARTLRFDTGHCDEGFLDEVAPPNLRPGLRTMGFTLVRCSNGRASRTLP